MTGPSTFRAGCRKTELVGAAKVPHACDRTFEGAEGAAQLKAHQRIVHGVKRFPIEPRMPKPTPWKAPRQAGPPPAGPRLDAFLAAQLPDALEG